MPKENEMEKDYTSLLDTEVPRLKEEAKNGNLSGALEGLFLLEKQTRQGGDFTTCAKIAREIVTVCYLSQNWTQLNDTLVMLSKRRGQSKTVIQEAVQEAMGILDSIDELPVAVELIKILRGITEGKIFVEVESAELTKRLAAIYEKTDKIKEAAKVLQEVQVETLSKMETKEKVNYILEQVRLCLASNDFIRALILSRKINQKIILKDDFQQEKLIYHHLMIRYYQSQKKYSEIAMAYQSIFNTPCVQEDESKWATYLKLLCIYAVLAPHSLEQSDVIHRTNEVKKLEELPLYKDLLKDFLKEELISWPTIHEEYKSEFEALPDFAVEGGSALWEILQLRVVEHNIRVIAQYYTRIHTTRLCELLALDQLTVEKRLSDLVVKGSIYARIDRPAGIINFSKPSAPVDMLNDWKGNVNGLLNLIEKTCHLVQRENMVHQHAKAKK